MKRVTSDYAKRVISPVCPYESTICRFRLVETTICRFCPFHRVHFCPIGSDRTRVLKKPLDARARVLRALVAGCAKHSFLHSRTSRPPPARRGISRAPGDESRAAPAVKVTRLTDSLVPPYAAYTAQRRTSASRCLLFSVTPVCALANGGRVNRPGSPLLRGRRPRCLVLTGCAVFYPGGISR